MAIRPPVYAGGGESLLLEAVWMDEHAPLDTSEDEESGDGLSDDLSTGEISGGIWGEIQI